MKLSDDASIHFDPNLYPVAALALDDSLYIRYPLSANNPLKLFDRCVAQYLDLLFRFIRVIGRRHCPNPNVSVSATHFRLRGSRLQGVKRDRSFPSKSSGTAFDCRIKGSRTVVGKAIELIILCLSWLLQY